MKKDREKAEGKWAKDRSWQFTFKRKYKCYITAWKKFIPTQDIKGTKTLITAILFKLTNILKHEVIQSLTELLWHEFAFFFFFWPCGVAFRIFVPQPGIKPMPPALGACSLDHWHWEVPDMLLKVLQMLLMLILTMAPIHRWGNWAERDELHNFPNYTDGV